MYFDVEFNFIHFCFIFTSVLSQQYVTRKTNYGDVIGKIVRIDETNTTAEVFLGVPYARPPVNECRFEYPEHPVKWTTPLKCLESNKMCVQLFRVSKKHEESEDCLTLNIVLPHINRNQTTFPVLVWLHGGSYFSGAGNNFPINTTIKNLVSKNIIVVFIHYRLGALGYLSLGNMSLPGNYGLEDQLFALKWVKDNIPYFNGDPNRVTLTGESAGAGSASLLAVSNKAKGLFQQVLLQSGSSISPWAVSNERTKQNSEQLLKSLNCTISNSATAVRECLQNISVAELSSKFRRVIIHSRMFSVGKEVNHWVLPPVTPVIDNYRLNESILEESPTNLLRRNARLPLMLGVTNFETLPYIVGACKTWHDIIASREAKKRVLSINLNVFNLKFPYTAENDSIIEWAHFLPSSIFNNVDFVYQSVQNFYNVNNGMNTLDMVKIIAKINGDYLFFSPAVSEATYYSMRNISVKFYVYSDDRNVHLLKIHQDDCFDLSAYPDAAAHGFDTARLFQSNSVSYPYVWTDELDTTHLPMTNFLSHMITSFVKTGNPQVTSKNGNDWTPFTVNNKIGLKLHPNDSKYVDIHDMSSNRLWHDIIPFVDNLECK